MEIGSVHSSQNSDGVPYTAGVPALHSLSAYLRAEIAQISACTREFAKNSLAEKLVRLQFDCIYQSWKLLTRPSYLMQIRANCGPPPQSTPWTQELIGGLIFNIRSSRNEMMILFQGLCFCLTWEDPLRSALEHTWTMFKPPSASGNNPLSLAVLGAS